MSTFKDLGLPKWLCETLAGVKITKPTNIQAGTIPQILKGKSCIGGAKTGSGKTISFAAPMLAKWAEDPCGIYGVILTPTRELAMQIAEQFSAMGSNVNLKTALIIGGQSMIEQSNMLKNNPDFVIATPGRLAHIIEEHPDDVKGLKRVKFIVLDEADRLLTESFTEHLGYCLKSLPDGKKRQTLLFTATVTDAVRSLKDKNENVFVYELDKIDDVLIPERLNLSYILTPYLVKEAILHHLLTIGDYKESTVMIFVNRSETCELIKRILKDLNVRVTSLHSEMPQSERTNSLHRFRAGAARVLVSTDLGGRGLDIPSVELVINYDIPRDPDDFIHRVGRTARAGRQGDALSFVTPNDLDRLLAIEDRIGRKMNEYEKVTDNEIIKDSLKVTFAAKVDARMEMDKENFGERKQKLREKMAERAGNTVANGKVSKIKPKSKSKSGSKK
ncbi:ATP-dependent RNA helicase [Pichia kluyveri]|uniref:ATP-dependent RNA helicase n=1 Tax=Pichia kluyveri TaxID=36015 RepID=A0AAV5R2P2_PICKL|nr:ATP-dependent RNA helicase [Pichia kluyveri]